MCATYISRRFQTRNACNVTVSQDILQFLANFGDRNRDGKVQRSEWNEYYAAVSSSIDNDDHFIQLMKTAWKL